MIVKLDCQYR